MVPTRSSLLALLGVQLIFLPLVACDVPFLEIDRGYPAPAYIERLTADLVAPSYKRQPKSIVTYLGLLTNSTTQQHDVLLSLTSYGEPGFPACKARPGQWCVTADYGNGTRNAPTVNVGDKLHFEVQRKSDKSGYTASITRNGQFADSFLVLDSSPSSFVWFVTSCFNEGIVVPETTYTNIKITLSRKDPTWLHEGTVFRSYQTDTGIYTNDGGLTYGIKTLKFQEYKCPQEFA